MARLGSATPLVGRVAELAAVSAAFERARGGQPGLVLVSGDAGVGKTRLLGELTERALGAGALVLVGRCLETGESGLPYLPFAEALQALVGTAEHAALEARPALTRMLPELTAETVDDDELGRLPLFDAAHGVLRDLAAVRPVLLVLEDLHWADRSTRDLLSFITARLRSERLLVVGSYRAEDLHRRHPMRGVLAELVRLPATDRLHVPAFEPSEADQFVRTVAAGMSAPDLTDAALRRIAERSEGNAFFAEELLASYTEAFGDDLPPALADVLLTRLESQPAPVRQVLRVAAVGGRRVRHRRLQRVAGMSDDELDDALRHAVEHQVLVADLSGEGYAFRHALMQEAIYGDLLPGQRSRLHGAYADALSTESGHGVAAELAHHSLASGAQATALAASVAAAAEASRHGAPAEALGQLETALRLWSAVPDAAEHAGCDEPELMKRAGIEASASGDPDRALAHFRAAALAVDDVADPIGAADIRRVLAMSLLAIDRTEEAHQVTGEALTKLGERPDSWVWAALMAEHARAAASQGHLDEADEYAERAAEAAKADGKLATVAATLITRGVVAYRRGHIPATLALLNEAAELAASDGGINTQLRALFNLSSIRFEYDRAADGLATTDEGIALAERHGLTWSTYGLELRVMHVLMRAVLGDWDDAERAAEIASGTVSGLVEARVAAAAVWVAIGRGRFEDADKQLALLRPYRHRDQQIAELVALGEVELHLWRDEPARAVEVVEELFGPVEQQVSTIGFMSIRFAALALSGCARLATQARERGDGVAERQVSKRAEEFASRISAVLDDRRSHGRAPGAEAHAWIAVADAEHEIVRGQDSAPAWQRAADLFGFGARYEQARCYWRLATALLAAGDREAADRPVRMAVETAERLGAEPLLAAASRLAERAGIGRRAGPPTGATGTALTPRERAVLQLAASGHTNRQIGAELFISEKTVSVHLSRVMAKLGASSRTEAVSLAHARGLLEPAGLTG